MKPKVVLLVVENRRYVLYNYLKFVSQLTFSGKIQGAIFYEGFRIPVWAMRRFLMKEALKTDCSHILFVDTDVVFDDIDFVEKLLAHNKDIVSGIYYDVEGNPCTFKNGKNYQGKGLKEVDLFATGASLIKRQVLKKVEYPTPNKVWDVDADMEFCWLAKKAGFKIYTDYDLIATHILLADVKKNKHTITP